MKAVTDDEIMSLAPFGDEAANLAEVVAAVGIAKDDEIAVSVRDSVAQRAAVTFGIMWTTRAPCCCAISTEPSEEPLSETTTSPFTPRAENAFNALSMQPPIEFASLRQGITTDTSTRSILSPVVGEWLKDCASGIRLVPPISIKYSYCVGEFSVTLGVQTGLPNNATG